MADATKTQKQYKEHKARALERIRSQSRSGRDIGELPDIVDMERRAAASRDLLQFCTSYFPHVFSVRFSDDHRKVIARMQTAILEGGLFALAMPRGTGKTSLCEVACLFALLNGHRQFVALIGATADHAVELLRSLQSELDSNDLLFADYPEVCYPIRCLEGIVHRAPGQLYRDERTRIGWTRHELVLPTIAPYQWSAYVRDDGYSLSSGSIVRVAGITGRIRGMKHKRADGASIRPSLVIIDDPQTDVVARSASQIAARERILCGAILGLAGPGVKISGIMPCTVIRPGDLADRMLDRSIHPEWCGERYKLVYQWPTNTSLWERYATIRAESLRAGGDGSEATEYYRAHREAMDEGAIVAWPERHNGDELSAIQHAMNLRFDLGDAAFGAEYQNEPPQEQTISSMDFSAESIGDRLNRRKRNEIPIGATHITAFVDVHAQLHYYMVCAWEPDATGYIVDYGTYPEQAISYFTLANAPVTIADRHAGMAADAAIYASLRRLLDTLLDTQYRRDDGVMMSIDRILVDANWGTTTDLVYQCIVETGASTIIPSHGKYIGASSRPMSEYRQRPGEMAGNHWRMPAGQGKRNIRHVTFDANYWKSFVATRLVTPLGSRGCLSIFGQTASQHRLLAEHLASEYRVAVEAQGRKVDEWKRRVEYPDNHWLDCLVGCAVAASMVGVAIHAGNGSNSSSKQNTKRMSYTEYIAQRSYRGTAAK